MSIPEIDVGSRIRAYRKRKKLSLNELARLTGIAASNLSSIELNKSSPTLSTLLKIAGAFNARASVFLDDLLYPSASLTRQGAGVQMEGAPPGLAVWLLCPQLEKDVMAPKLIRIAPGSGPFVAGDQYVERFVYCLQGESVARVKQEAHELHTGDSLYVRTDAALQLENRSEEETTLLIVTAPPIRG
jgi:transcriptional regulator with XRE-family HTH domain